MNGAAKGILVTGGAGFIGSNFILDWIRAGLGQVVNVDKLTYAGNRENLAEVADHQSFVMVEEDICDQAAMERLLLKYKPRAIVHFAAETHVDRSILGPKAFLRTNVEGTMSLLEASRAYCGGLGVEDRKAFRFLHVSTDEVYGSLGPDDAAFHEATPYSPNSPYAASKAASDHLVRAWFHTYGLPTMITNCSNNYGPFQFPEKLIPLMLTHALAGKPLPIYGDGQQIRDWLYVGDHTSALRTVLQKGRVGETYNVGGNNQRSNLEVVTTLCSLLDELVPESRYRPHRELLTYVTDRPGHDRRYAIDARKLKQELGWEPSETFETGVRRTVEWYLANPAWVEHVLSGSYQNWVTQNYGSRGAAEDAGDGKTLEPKAVTSGEGK